MRSIKLSVLTALSLAVLTVHADPKVAGQAASLHARVQTPITLTYYWWGESDLPGADKWMNRTIALFEKAHPNIQIKLAIQSTDSWVSNFQAAAAARKGPDLATQGATLWVLSQAWAGAIVPVSDYIPKSESKHWVNTSENVYAGKIWAMPLYIIGIPVVYNKSLFRKAGLNPNDPPHTWAQFLVACAKLKAKGIIPFSLGDKDGWGGAWFWSTFGKGTLDSADDIKRAVIGQSHFTDPKLTQWLSALQTMMKSGYINNDVASLDLNNGFTPFVRGKAAMTLSTDANIVSYIKALGEQNIGIFRAPAIGSGKLASWYDATQSSSEMITAWSPHKREAAMFLMFMHTPERLKALYEQTGGFPADDRFDRSVIKDPLQKQMLAWDQTLPSIWAENFVPSQLDINGDQTAAETIISGSGTVGTAAQLWERTAHQWRVSNPDQMKHFQSWIGRKL